MADPDASAEDRSIVRASADRARRAQEQERAALERETSARREAARQEREERRTAEEKRREEEAERRATEKRELAPAAEAKERERIETAQREARLAKAQWYAPAVRGALKKAARERRTTTWEEIGEKTGLHQMARLDLQEQVELLSAVRSVDSSSSSLRLHRLVAQRLLRELPDDDTALLNELADERLRLHRLL
ncbi:hypothetical protein AB0A77_37450 [Streptomyces varsoviensis]|uniref:hypothetical protein n=1 Tax=Streptomyces varsoviensis TaxID=67373 RepID=UPI0034052844